MEKKFGINLEQAMEILSLNTKFTEKEFKSSYRKLIMSIHPDTLGKINPIVRKILEREVRKINVAKEVIESFVKQEYSNCSTNKNSSYYKPGSTSNNNQNPLAKESGHQDILRKKRVYQEQQRKTKYYQELSRKSRERENHIKRNSKIQEQQQKTREYRAQNQRHKKITIIIIVIIIIIAIYIIRPTTLNPQ